VAELKQQLQKLAGSDSPSEVKSDPSVYPSIRKLPLLGATYFDLYRESKIQEALYQLLIQEYELAKVQEAKEIPTVNVLDVAVVPTKKSFPPRTKIVVSGTLLAVMGTVAWIFLCRWWSGIAPDDPGLELAGEMGESFRASARRLATHWATRRLQGRNGNGASEQETPQEGEGGKEEERTTDVSI
jgi:hypothetical protein